MNEWISISLERDTGEPLGRRFFRTEEINFVSEAVDGRAVLHWLRGEAPTYVTETFDEVCKAITEQLI